MYDIKSSIIRLCYIVPEVLHTGVGGEIYRMLEQEAIRRSHTKILLNSTITAYEFYRKYGYKQVGDLTYHGNVLAIPMRKEVSVQYLSAPSFLGLN